MLLYKNTSLTNTYSGTKTLLGTSMSLGEYNAYRGWITPEDEDPDKPGFMVEYEATEDSEPNHPDHLGYISWSPEGVFNATYRENGYLTFGDAVKALKEGERVARKGWNGKNMFLFLLPASDNIPTSVINDPTLRQVIEDEVGGDTFDALGSIRMFTADKKILTGWLASQSDILAEDWTVVV